MAHKTKKYENTDNSRKAYRWRLKHNCLTDADKQRLETKNTASQISKHSNPYVMHKHKNTKSDFLRAR